MIDIKNNAEYRRYFLQGIQMVSDCTPSIIYAYSDEQQIERFYADGFCWQTGVYKNKLFYFPPYGNWKNVNWREVLKNNVKPGTLFHYIPEYLLNLWVTQIPTLIDFEETRDEFDYIYYIDRQVAAKGADYENFRTIRHKFEREYSFEIKDITDANLYEAIRIHEKFIAVSKELGRESDELLVEDTAFHKIMPVWKDFDLEGKLLYVDGVAIAFVFWEKLDKINALNVFAKSDSSNKFAATYLLQHMFEQLSKDGYMILNTMADAGVQGLRYAKKSQNPLMLIKKYDVVYLGE